MSGVKALAALVVVLVISSLAAEVESARACSCALPDARAALAQGDGAFVGRLVSRREAGQQAILTFSVEKALKGSIGSTVEVVTASNSAACGIEMRTGTRTGLVLERSGGAWQGYLCSQFDPEELLAAALPLPAPNGRGPVALILGAELGDVRLLALDARGRTLAYGRGGGSAGLVSLCPGRQRLAELAYAGGRPTLVVREAQTLRALRRQRLRIPAGRNAQRLSCEDRSGESVVLFARGPGDSGAGSALVRVARGRLSEIWTGAAHDAAIGSTAAYLSGGLAGASLLRVDLVGRRVRRLAALPGPTIALSLDRTGTVVAGVHARLDRSSQVVRVDLRRPTRVRTVRLPADEGLAQVLWLAGGRLLFVPAYGSTARVLDASLRTRSRFRWKATTAAVVGSQLYGIDISRTLFRASLPFGPQRLARQLPGRPTLIVSATG